MEGIRNGARVVAPSPDITMTLLAGYYELRRDKDGGVEIAYFGLLPEFIGRGLGGALLTSAIEEAWSAVAGSYLPAFGCIRATAIIRRRSRIIRRAG